VCLSTLLSSYCFCTDMTTQYCLECRYLLMTLFITTRVSSYIGTFCVLRHDYPVFNKSNPNLECPLHHIVFSSRWHGGLRIADENCQAFFSTTHCKCNCECPISPLAFTRNDLHATTDPSISSPVYGITATTGACPPRPDRVRTV
jgi:hypothetical protein